MLKHPKVSLLLRRIGAFAALALIYCSSAAASNEASDSPALKAHVDIEAAAIRARLRNDISASDRNNWEKVNADIQAILPDEESLDPGLRHWRKTKVELWLTLINKLPYPRALPDSDRPTINVMPPSGGGVAGVDPKAIPDPKARKEYEDALSLNREKAAVTQANNNLRWLRRDLVKSVQFFINNNYSDSEEDKQEIASLVDENVSARDKDAIRAQLSPKPHKWN